MQLQFQEQMSTDYLHNCLSLLLWVFWKSMKYYFFQSFGWALRFLMISKAMSFLWRRIIYASYICNGYYIVCWLSLKNVFKYLWFEFILAPWAPFLGCFFNMVTKRYKVTFFCFNKKDLKKTPKFHIFISLVRKS